MTEPSWLGKSTVVDIQAEQLALFGGSPGLRDEGLLESALSRPMNKWASGESDMAVLAASYAYGLARNHPFVDGNKRIAFLAMLVFLRINGVPFRPAPPAATAIMLEVAAGAIGEEGLSRWIRDNWP